MEQYFLADFGSEEDLSRFWGYHTKPDEFKRQHPTGIILLAYYSYEDYSGEAFVLFEENGKLYTVHASHCSCYGLEDQWDPEEIELETLKHIVTEGGMGYSDIKNKYRDELREVVGFLESGK